MIWDGLQTYRQVISRIEEIRTYHHAQVVSGKLPYYVADPELGWSIAVDRRHSVLPYSSDRHGFRRTAISDADDALPVVSVWGDSIVHGDEVGDADTWLWQLQERLANRYRVVNGGISAYGCDQATLRFARFAARVQSDVAVLCYVTADLYRHINIQRAFHFGSNFPFLKPRYVVEDGYPRLISPPPSDIDTVAEVMRRPDVQELLKRYDRFYPFLDRQLIDGLAAKIPPLRHVGRSRTLRAEALEVTLAIFGEFQRRCSESGTAGVILLLPVLLGPNRSGDDFDWLVSGCKARDISCSDLRVIFSGTNAGQAPDFFCPKRHYNRKGGAVVAEAVAELVMRATHQR